jgi:WD40 repeat protein
MRAIVAVLLGLAFAMPGTAAATVGSLDFGDCVSSDAATTGCTDLSATTSALDGATHAIAVSGDGTSVYVAATNADAVAHFSRDASTGALTFKDCIASGDSPGMGCADVTTATTSAMEGPTAIVMSRDGRDVYVAGARAVVHLVRDLSSGGLSFADCISSDAGATACATVMSTTTVGSFDALRLGSEDHHLYASGGTTLVHLTRSVLDGSLLFTDCLSGAAAAGCTNVTASNGFSGVESVAPSPDGKNLYAGTDGTVYDLRLNAAGTPAFGDCLTTAPSTTGCTKLSPSSAFSSLENLAISPDGANVYVSAELGGLTTLARDATTGTVTFDSCIASGTVSGCTDVSAASGALTSLDGITISPDGRSVYTAGADAAVHLVRDPSTGGLTPADCFALGAVTGCTDISAQTNALADLQEITISPGGDTAYVAAEATDAVLRFRRQVAPVCSAAAVPVAHDTPATVPLACTDANGDALTRSIASPPGHGTLGAVDQAAGTVAYTPAAGFAGPDGFTFTAGDGRDQSAPATASLAVAAGAPAPPDTTAPVITRLSARATHRKRGGSVRLTLSEAGTVTVRIKRAVAGRRVGKACRKPTRANRRRKRCTRYRGVGAFKLAGVAGANRKAFGGKLRRKKLRVGRHRVSAKATDAAGNASKTRVAGFKVKRR